MPTDHTPSPWEGHPVINESTQKLSVVLTEQERTDRGRGLGLQSAAVDALEHAQKEAMKAFREAQREEMDAALHERNSLRSAVNTGEEPRPVKCVTVADYGKGIAYTVRTDTSNVVETRRLLEDEVQVQMGVALHVVPNPKTGKIERVDGRDVDSLPVVRKSQCEPVGCRECGQSLGSDHDGECDLRGVGKAAVVAEDQLDPLTCADCSAEHGSMHNEGCEHFEAGADDDGGGE